MTTAIEKDILIQAGHAKLKGNLAIPENATGIVVFVHGSGSGRFSPRNRSVAFDMQRLGLGTLLFDLLEEWESDDRRKVFDIDLLSDRLLLVTDWLASNSDTTDLNLGYFGASTGAAAALQAASQLGDNVSAVVSRGGRPDLASDYLSAVTAPTLLIVGGDDSQVIPLNESAYNLLQCTKELAIVPGAGHLFEEPGTLEQVARLAGSWFKRFLS